MNAVLSPTSHLPLTHTALLPGETPLGMLSWGSNPFAYAPDGSSSSAHGEGEGAANLESGLDNGPVMEGVPFNKTGLYLEDEYDAGYTGMYLMDCQAQIALAKMIGRDAAAAELQSRFDVVNKVLAATSPFPPFVTTV